MSRARLDPIQPDPHAPHLERLPLGVARERVEGLGRVARRRAARARALRQRRQQVELELTRGDVEHGRDQPVVHLA